MAIRLPLQAPTQREWTVAHEWPVVASRRPEELLDLTGIVLRYARLSGVCDGTVTVQPMHTTAAILVNEHEPLLLEGLRRMLASWAPADGRYSHDDFGRRTVNMARGERPNGHAHARSMLLQASITLALIDGEVQIWKWQRIFLAELDGPRERGLVVTTAGLLGGYPCEWPPQHRILPESVGGTS